jgi:hypothetical protein
LEASADVAAAAVTFRLQGSDAVQSAHEILKIRKPERSVDIRNVPYSRANLPGNGNAWSREDSNSVSRGASFAGFA